MIIVISAAEQQVAAAVATAEVHKEAAQEALAAVAQARYAAIEQVEAVRAAQTAAMLREQGFNGLGAWSDTARLRAAPQKLAYTHIWNFMSGYGKKRGGTYQLPGHTGYPNNAIFAEFKWGSFFRTRVIFNEQLTSTRKNPVDMTLGDIQKADPDDYNEKIRYALYLGSSPEAAGLPGFVGRLQ